MRNNQYIYFLINLYMNNVYIYKLYCKNKNIPECYIGSTRNINKRITYHRISTHNKNDTKYNRSMYQFIRNNGGFKNWKIDIIKTFKNIEKNIENNKLIRIIERHFIIKNNSKLNINLPICNKYCVNFDLYYPLICKIACLFYSSLDCNDF